MIYLIKGFVKMVLFIVLLPILCFLMIIDMLQILGGRSSLEPTYIDNITDLLSW